VPAGDGRGLSPGRVFAGTSGFAYPDWAPRFYPAGLRGDGLLRHYATRLAACELNNTFYARPKPERIAAWIAAVPDGFRFIVKGQRGATFRALFGDPADAVAWLTEPLPGFGEKLGGVLFRLDERTVRDDGRLAGLLGAWPSAIPLVVEAQHPSWHVDETFAVLREAGAVLCATDLDDLEEPPTIRRTGPFLYLRLRRSSYSEAELDAWAARVAPFTADGLDAYVVFRHDEDGTSALRAEGFPARVTALMGS
jgi:uncharacterized protein YecE (DUF72 family)